MEKLYRESKASILQFGELLQILEKSVLPDEVNASKQNIQSKLNEISNGLDQLDIYVSKEPANRRYDSKMKVDQLKYDLQHLRAAFNTIQYKK